MEIGCNSYSLRGLPRREALARIGALGFRAVELWAGHASWAKSDVDPGQVVVEAAASGVRVHAYCVGGLFGLPRAEVERRLARAFTFARALGTDLVTGIIDRGAAPVVDALCGRLGMRFAIENHWYTEFARPDDYGPVLDGCSAAIGVNIDTGHFAFLGCDLAAVARTLGPRTLNVHLKAVRPARPLARLIRRRRRRFRVESTLPGPGDGLDAFGATLAATGYTGLLAVEHEGDGDPGEALDRWRTRATTLVGGSRLPPETLQVRHA